MTSQHATLECYACHASWNVDFFGFHFDRNEQFTQLDLLSGRRTPGRVTTQEKVFATFNQLRLGFNHEARIANYMVGFSTIGSAHDQDGAPLLDQALPLSAAGLSGVTLVAHQPHTTRPEARDCVECHRAPPTWGLGSTNFRLTREFAFAVDPRGLTVLALDHKQPAFALPAAELALPERPRAIALRMDPIRGRATHAYIGLEGGALAIVNDARENDFLYASFAAFRRTHFYVDGRDDDTEGSFYTRGGPLPFSAWAPGEPNNVNNEDCVELADTGWNDVPCEGDTKNAFICEIPGGVER